MILTSYTRAGCVGRYMLYGRFPGLDELLNLYAEADRRTGAFLRLSGLGCLPMCGRCCDTLSLNIESTLFEVLPLAIRLWEKGRAESVHSLASDAGDNGRCVLYDPSGPIRGAGGCLEYGHWPLICRLFGFSAYRGKDGLPSLGLCREIRSRDAAKALAAGALLASGVDLPLMSGFSSRAMGISPGLSSRKQGINAALAAALEKVMLTAGMLGLKPDKDRLDGLDAMAQGTETTGNPI